MHSSRRTVSSIPTRERTDHDVGQQSFGSLDTSSLLNSLLWVSRDILMGGDSFASANSSSPIRISRDTQTVQFLQISKLHEESIYGTKDKFLGSVLLLTLLYNSKKSHKTPKGTRVQKVLLRKIVDENRGLRQSQRRGNGVMFRLKKKGYT